MRSSRTVNLRQPVDMYIYVYISLQLSLTEQLTRQMKLFTTSNPNKEDRLAEITEQTLTILVIKCCLIVMVQFP